jgi:hypothetical protein
LHYHLDVVLIFGAHLTVQYILRVLSLGLRLIDAHLSLALTPRRLFFLSFLFRLLFFLLLLAGHVKLFLVQFDIIVEKLIDFRSINLLLLLLFLYFSN